MESGRSHSVERTLGEILATQKLILIQLEKSNNKLEEHIAEDRQLEKRVDRMESRLYTIGSVFIFLVTFASDFILTKMGLK